MKYLLAAFYVTPCVLAAREINSIWAMVSIKKALVSFLISFLSLYAIPAFPLCKNGLLLSFSGKTT
jgi:hypothetical protein